MLSFSVLLVQCGNSFIRVLVELSSIPLCVCVVVLGLLRTPCCSAVSVKCVNCLCLVCDIGSLQLLCLFLKGVFPEFLCVSTNVYQAKFLCV